jgi:hypothetical protein
MPDYMHDSEEVLRRNKLYSITEANMDDNHEESTMTIKNMFTVDVHSNMNKTGELLWHEKDGHCVPYDCLLIKYAPYDQYTYHIMQIIKRIGDVNNSFVLFERWGKLGSDECQHKSSAFTTDIKSIEKFNKIFKQKTMNDFVAVHLNNEQFQLKANKFISVSYKDRMGHKFKDVHFELPTNIEYSIATGETCDSKLLLNEYKKLFLDLLDVSFIKSKYQNDMLPLVRVSRALVEAAKTLLLTNVKPLLNMKLELEKQRKKDESNRYVNTIL